MQIEENIRVAYHGLTDHKFRSFLTMLGIIFGVASVIAMLSIGEGAKRQAIAKYQDLGVNNIIIREKEMTGKELQDVRARFSEGLTEQEANMLKELVPGIESVAPQSEKSISVKLNDLSSRATLIGITPSFINIINYTTDKGSFITSDHYERQLKVCVLGAGVAREMFPFEDPIGKQVNADGQWFEVVGVMSNKALFTETVGELASRNLNNDIYIPLTTFKKRISKNSNIDSEIKQITVKVGKSNQLLKTSEVINNIIKRHHFDNEDFSMIIPYELMKQEEKERKIYNFLLASIAAISLIVGGIGIMNIMLATVMERTREIGIRRAIGAKKNDILSQFVTEAVAISITGGLIGVFLGLSLSLVINWTTDVNTFITFYSVIIAFTFSVIVGITFGYLPAKKAANLSPIESIRYE